MAIALNDNIKVNAPKPSEERYLNGILSYSSTTDVDLATVGRRYLGLTVYLNGEEYWYKNTIADGGLIAKSFAAVNGVAGTGTTNTLPKWGSSTGLTNSNFSDNGTSGFYTFASSQIVFIPGGGSWLRFTRNQAQADFMLGNPDIAQTFDIQSNNYYGATFKSKGFFTINVGSAYTEALRVSPTGLFQFNQTPPSGSSTDFILARDLSGNVTQIPQSGFTDNNAVHKTGDETIFNVKTFQYQDGNTTSLVLANYSAQTIFKSVNSFGNIDFQIIQIGPGQGAFKAGTPNAYLEGRNAGPTYLKVSVPVESPEPVQSNHLTTKNYVDSRLSALSPTITGTTNIIPKYGTSGLTDSQIFDNGTLVTVNSQLNQTGIIYTNLGMARGTYLNSTLIPAANNETIIALDINPIFNISGFTGINAIGIRVNGGIVPYFDNNVNLGSVGANWGRVRTRLIESTNGGYLDFAYNAVTHGRLFSSGNWIFQSGGTYTDNGVDKLQVNGSIIATSIKKSGGTAIQFLMADGSTSTGFTTVTYWSAGTGINSIVVTGNNNMANGDYALAEGLSTSATSFVTHAEGYQTQANGLYSHAEGNQTKANGISSHSEGTNNIAGGNYSHAGGINSQANGLTSFVHGDNSIASNTNTIVLGANITGNASDTTYVDNFNIKTVLSGTSVKNLGLDVNGNVIASSSSFILGSGTTNQVAFFGSSNSIIGDTGFIWDNTNKRLGIGALTPTARLTIQTSNNLSTGGIRLLGNTFPSDVSYWSESQFVLGYNGIITNVINSVGPSFFNSGNVLIGKSGDTSERFQVSGNSKFVNSVSTATTVLISSTTQSALIVIGSGNSTTLPIFSVQGSQGELFSVTDSLTGSLFSVNDISGLPVIEAFSDSTILMGNFQAPALNTTVKVIANLGITNIYSIPTSTYNGAWIDYTVNNGSSLRAGSLMSVFSGTNIQYTETSTTDIGNTSGITFSMIISGASAIYRASGVTSGWTIKSIIRSI